MTAALCALAFPMQSFLGIEILAAVREVEGNYARHARAARTLAEAHFDSDKVLTELLEYLGTE